MKDVAELLCKFKYKKMTEKHEIKRKWGNAIKVGLINCT